MKLTLKVPANDPPVVPSERVPAPEAADTRLKLVTDLEACGPDTFYSQHPRDTLPQPVRLELDAEGRIRVYVDPSVPNAVPGDVMKGRTLRWNLPAGILPAEVRRLLAEARPLLERIHAGHRLEWNAYEGEHVGHLTADAIRAEDDLWERITKSDWKCLETG